MTGAAFLLVALAAAAAAGDWLAVHAQRKPVEYLCKPLTLVLLTAAAAALDPADGAVRAWFVAALVLSLVGDVLLMLPSNAFTAGLASFLLAHVAYIVGMHLDGVAAAGFLFGIAVVLVLLAVVGGVILRRLRSGPDAALAGPVIAYMAVISLMVASAFGTGRWIVILAACLFYVSDTLIAWNRFCGQLRRGPLAIMVTYHLAQAAFVVSLV